MVSDGVLHAFSLASRFHLVHGDEVFKPLFRGVLMTYTMRPSLVLSTSLLTCALFLFACDNDEPGEGGAEDMSSTPDMMTDAGMTPDVDMSVGDDGGDTPDLPVIEPDMPADMMVDAGEDMAGQDMAEQVTCDPFPTPALSQEAAAVALAANPARCQQPAYQWLDDATLGDVIQTVEGQTYDALTLNLLVGASGVELPVQLDYDEEYGYVSRLKNKDYVVGTQALYLSAIYTQSNHLEQIRPIVDAIRDISGETASFFVEEDSMRICLYRAHSRDEIRHNIEQGSRLELNRGASGRIILAYGKRKNDKTGFYKDIRDAGFYLSIHEHNASLFALAVPVISSSSKFVGAIVVSGPISRFNDKQKIFLLKLLRSQLNNIVMP